MWLLSILSIAQPDMPSIVSWLRAVSSCAFLVPLSADPKCSTLYSVCFSPSLFALNVCGYPQRNVSSSIVSLLLVHILSNPSIAGEIFRIAMSAPLCGKYVSPSININSIFFLASFLLFQHIV